MEQVKSEVKNDEPQVQKGGEKEQTPGGETTPVADQTSNDPGTEFADFKDPKDAARFKRIYGHVKRSDRIIGTMAEDARVLYNANQKLTDRLAALETHLVNKGASDSLIWLQTERRTAVEAGDLARVADLSDKIADVKLRSEVGRLTQPRQAPLVQMAQPQQDFLGPDLQSALKDWAGEKDKSGAFIRPWAQETHPKFRRAVEMAAAVLNDPEFQGEDSDSVLNEVDRLMGQVKQSSATVLSGKEHATEPKGPKLTAEQVTVARKMGVSPERYAAQMQIYRKA